MPERVDPLNTSPSVIQEEIRRRAWRSLFNDWRWWTAVWVYPLVVGVAALLATGLLYASGFQLAGDDAMSGVMALVGLTTASVAPKVTSRLLDAAIDDEVEGYMTRHRGRCCVRG